MFFKPLAVSAVLMLGWALTGLQAQEALPASGGEASGNGGSVSFTVGQVACTFQTGNECSVSQGVQQPYEIYTVVETTIPKGLDLFYTCYPNPVTDNLILKTETDHPSHFIRFQLHDMNGKLLKNGKIKGSTTPVHMADLSPGTYLLRVIDGSTEIITFKIIKNP